MLLKQNTPVTSFLVAVVLFSCSFVRAQNVGIGVAQPTSRLHLNGDIAFTSDALALISVNKSPTGYFGTGLTIKAGSVTTAAYGLRGGKLVLQAGNGLIINANDYAGGDVIVRSGGNVDNALNGPYNSGNIIFEQGGSFNTAEDKWTEMMRIDYLGNVGIGMIAAPQIKLDVNGTLRVTGFQMVTGAATGAVLTTAADGTSSWTALNSIESDPQVGINTANFLSKWNGTALVSSTVFENNGNVGIGTQTPGAALQVVGKTKTDGFEMSTGALNGFVLRTDASGVASWVNPSTLAITETDPQVGNNTTNFLSKWNGTQLVSSTVVENTGNVGIGIAPARRLDVSGTGGLRVSSTNPGTGTTDWIAGNFGGTDDDRVVMGNLNSAATLGAHNNALNAWANLAINPGGGNVGIGLANPLNKLDVEGGVAIGSSYAGTSTSPSNGAIIEGRLGVGLPNPTAQLDVFGDFKLGKSGSELNNIIKATVTFAARPFPANASTGTTYAVAGVGVGGSVMVSPSSPLPSGLVIAFASVSSNGNVDVVFCNTLGAPINYGGGINLFITVVN
jgi:hypothetical protein